MIFEIGGIFERIECGGDTVKQEIRAIDHAEDKIYFLDGGWAYMSAMKDLVENSTYRYISATCSSSTFSPAICTCTSRDLFNFGCCCGYLKRRNG